MSLGWQEEIQQKCGLFMNLLHYWLHIVIFAFLGQAKLITFSVLVLSFSVIEMYDQLLLVAFSPVVGRCGITLCLCLLSLFSFFDHAVSSLLLICVLFDSGCISILRKLFSRSYARGIKSSICSNCRLSWLYKRLLLCMLGWGEASFCKSYNSFVFDTHSLFCI